MARDFPAEYRQRIERGLARGFSRSQAAGHPRKNELPVSQLNRMAKEDQHVLITMLPNQGRAIVTIYDEEGQEVESEDIDIAAVGDLEDWLDSNELDFDVETDQTAAS